MARFLEDLGRLARGVGLVAARAAADSGLGKGLARGDVEQRLQASVRDALRHGQEFAQAAQGAGEQALQHGSAAAQQAAHRARPSLQRTVNEASCQGSRFADTAQAFLQQGEHELRKAANSSGGATVQATHRLQQSTERTARSGVKSARDAAHSLQHASAATARSSSVAAHQHANPAAAATARAAPLAGGPTLPQGASSTGSPAFDPAAGLASGDLTTVPSPEAAGYAAAQRSAPNAMPARDPPVPAQRTTEQPQGTERMSQPPRLGAAVADPLAAAEPRHLEEHLNLDTSVAAAPGATADPILDLQRAQASAQASRSLGVAAEDARSDALAGSAMRTDSEAGDGDTAGALNSGGTAAVVKPADALKGRPEEVRRKQRQRRVPSSRLGRVAGFAGLGASLAFGTLRDSVGNMFRARDDSMPQQSAVLSEANAERLANALCRMRGAALKLGQMLSIQDDNVLPPQFQAALDRVRAGADNMPVSQLDTALVGELGSDWRSKVADFDYEPLAAASIGQVHAATTLDGREVVMKIQYPGVAQSIRSDVDNLLRLIGTFNLLPKGMYVQQAAEVAKEEMALECEYEHEALCQTRFKALVAADPDLSSSCHVPAVVEELSAKRLLTSERVPGVAIDQVRYMPAEVRNKVGTLLLQLTLKELFEWRFMQTDPNWGNFLYDEHADRLHLIDFGASREFPETFVSEYLEMVKACADRDREEVIKRSLNMGFLSGDESENMLDAHTQAGFLVGVPFAHEGAYDFALHDGMTKKVGNLGATMVKERLVPPPREAYSLHRKLSGAFLACIKLQAVVPCRQLFLDTYEQVKATQAAAATNSVDASVSAI